jgi:DNA-binding NtrC family response regulator
MAEVPDFMKKYDFECTKCGFKLTWDSAAETAYRYGLILLFGGENEGFVGWSCPACNAQVTNLTRVEDYPCWFFRQIQEHSKIPEIFLNFMYQSFPYNFAAVTDSFISKRWYFSDSGYEDIINKNLPDPMWPPAGQYLSFSRDFSSDASGPARTVFCYNLEQIYNLLSIENKNHVKSFPRYQIDDWLNSTIRNFCWHYRIRYNFTEEISYDKESTISINPDKIPIQLSYEFLTILDKVNSLNIAVPINSDRESVPSYYAEIAENYVYLGKETRFYQKNDFSVKLWKEFHSNRFHEILYNLAEEFVLDYSNQILKADNTKLSVLFLVGSYIEKLYDAVISRQKFKILNAETTLSAKKRVENAEKSFPNVKIISNDPYIDKLKQKISQRAPLPKAYSFLILGERGTGKDLFAKAIHEASKMKGSFVKVDCGAISEKLFESELFGYVKGAFTGANRDTPGKFCAAMDGTIFFDEIGNLPLSLQPKLLRALQDRQYVPVGANHPKTINAKFVFATNKDLEKMVNEESFMADLYDRFKRPYFTVPPLRERKNDIPILASYFIKKHDSPINEIEKLEPISIDKKCIRILMEYRWPGNIRELEGVISEIILDRNAENDRTAISESDLPDDLIIGRKSGSIPGMEPKKKLLGNTKIEDDNKIIRCMSEFNHNKSRVAKHLGVTYQTILRRCNKLGI